MEHTWIKRGKWQSIGHSLRKDENSIAKKALVGTQLLVQHHQLTGFALHRDRIPVFNVAHLLPKASCPKI